MTKASSSSKFSNSRVGLCGLPPPEVTELHVSLALQQEIETKNMRDKKDSQQPYACLAETLNVFHRDVLNVMVNSYYSYYVYLNIRDVNYKPL